MHAGPSGHILPGEVQCCRCRRKHPGVAAAQSCECLRTLSARDRRDAQDQAAVFSQVAKEEYFECRARLLLRWAADAGTTRFAGSAWQTADAMPAVAAPLATSRFLCAAELRALVAASSRHCRVLGSFEVLLPLLKYVVRSFDNINFLADRSATQLEQISTTAQFVRERLLSVPKAQMVALKQELYHTTSSQCRAVLEAAAVLLDPVGNGRETHFSSAQLLAAEGRITERAAAFQPGRTHSAQAGRYLQVITTNHAEILRARTRDDAVGVLADWLVAVCTEFELRMDIPAMQLARQTISAYAVPLSAWVVRPHLRPILGRPVPPVDPVAPPPRPGQRRRRPQPLVPARLAAAVPRSTCDSGYLVKPSGAAVPIPQQLRLEELAPPAGQAALLPVPSASSLAVTPPAPGVPRRAPSRNPAAFLAPSSRPRPLGTPAVALTGAAAQTVASTPASASAQVPIPQRLLLEEACVQHQEVGPIATAGAKLPASPSASASTADPGSPRYTASSRSAPIQSPERAAKGRVIFVDTARSRSVPAPAAAGTRMPAAVGAAAALLKVLGSRCELPAVRCEAARMLSRFGRGTAFVVPALRGVAADRQEDAAVRRAAAEALGAMGQAAALLTFLDDTHDCQSSPQRPAARVAAEEHLPPADMQSYQKKAQVGALPAGQGASAVAALKAQKAGCGEGGGAPSAAGRAPSLSSSASTTWASSTSSRAVSNCSGEDCWRPSDLGSAAGDAASVPLEAAGCEEEGHEAAEAAE